MSEEQDLPQEDIKPKKKVGRPTREEAARKKASRPGRRPGSKNKSSKLKEDEAKEKLLRYILSGIETMGTLCLTAQSETVRSNCAKWLVEMGLQIYSEKSPEVKPMPSTGSNQSTTDNSNVKIFPFSKTQNQ